ncbi:MAG: HD domain-containing protein [Deltaproteobacteria bacterium]|nr:HD domain-containing protein [Deltaproteobacteria bacterium]
MAKLDKEKYFSIDPMSLVEGRTLTFDVLVYLELNQRIIVFKRAGIVIDDLEKIKSMVAKGLKGFQLRESDRAAYEAYLRGGAAAPGAAVAAAAVRLPGEAEEASIGLPEPQTQELSADDLSAAPNARAAKKIEEEAAALTEEEKKKRLADIETLNAETTSELEKKAPDVPPAGKEFVPEKSAEQLMAGLLAQAPENIKSRDDAKEMVKNILKASGASQGVADIVDNPDTEHATSVAIYSTLFAMGLKKTDQQILQDIIIASLMHDIGFTQLNPVVLNTPRTKLSSAQKAVFETHVMFGMSLLADIDYFPNKRVITLLSQHHEKFNGTGYPAHLESFRVDELAQLISIADLIDTIMRGKYDGTARQLGDALHVVAQIERTTSFPEYFNPDVFKKVMTWLKKGGGEDYITAAEKAVVETKNKMLKTA